MNEMPSVERTPEIQEKIDTIRALPQRTEQESLEKEEAAKLLRQELTWGNALLMWEMLNTMETDPAIDPKKLLENTTVKGHIVNPVLTAKLAQEISTTVERSNNYWESIQREAAIEGLPVETYIYQSLIPIETLNKENKTRSEYKPKNPVKVTKYPLAVQIEFSPEDFAVVDKRTNIGGYYDRAHNLHTGEMEEGSLIVAKDSTDKKFVTQVYKHEQGHSKNALVDKALNIKSEEDQEKMTAKFFKDLRVLYDALNGKSREEIQVTLLDNPEYQKYVQALLLQCEMAASDEIEADKNAGIEMAKYVATLTTSDTYDYVNIFMEYIGDYENSKKEKPDPNAPSTKPAQELHDYLYEIYTEKLKRDTKVAVDLDNYYMRFSPQRAKLFRESLKMISLYDWNEFYTEALFVEEVQEFRSLKEQCMEIKNVSDYPMIVVGSAYKLTPQAQSLIEESQKISQQEDILVKSALVTPINLELTKLQVRADEIQSEICQTPDYEVALACYEIRKLGHSKDADGYSIRDSTSFLMLEEDFGEALIHSSDPVATAHEYLQKFQASFTPVTA